MRTKPAKLRFVMVPSLALSLASCVSLPPEPPGQGPLPLRAEAGEEPSIGRRPEWGLALSGGGLRSALFSIGVLKALFDARQLDRFRVLSTVSGGSYAAYWLYTNELAAGPAPGAFGQQSLGAPSFNRRVCELMTSGNFVTYPQMVTRGLTRRGAVRLYDESIARTFGSRDTEPPIRIAQVRPGTPPPTAAPYLVVNSTLIRPRPKGWRTGLYETTPLLAGNAEFGYLPWPDGSPPLRETVSVSGAAVQPLLRQEILTPNPQLNRLRPLATDGGTSENLGAIALIRRGVSNVVIVDAEHDPKLRYGAYVNLRDRLRSYGAVLDVPSIEAQTRRPGNPKVGTSLHFGTSTSRAADGTVVTSRIYYLKMRISPGVEAQLRDMTFLRDGEAADERFRLARQSGAVGCPGVDGLPPVPRSLFVYNVAGYGDYINERSPVRFTRHLPAFFRGQFPHYLTPDQSFYTDQVLAFLGLGVLEGEALAATLPAAQ